MPNTVPITEACASDTSTHVLSDQPQTNSKLSVLLCGNTDLQNEQIASKVTLVDQLGRRKLKDKSYVASASNSEAQLLWLAPRKYWTYSKQEESLQDISLNLAETFLSQNKDVVIVCEKNFHFKNKAPQKVLHAHYLPGHTVYCNKQLKSLAKLVGPSDNEELLTYSLIQCLHKRSLGAEQMIKHSQKFQSYPLNLETTKLPEAPHPRISKSRQKGKGSKLPEPGANRKTMNKAKNRRRRRTGRPRNKR